MTPSAIKNAKQYFTHQHQSTHVILVAMTMKVRVEFLNYNNLRRFHSEFNLSEHIYNSKYQN